MSAWSPKALSIFSFTALLALAAPARAQDVATAEALFNRGMTDLEAGRYETACKAIAESHRLDPRPGTLFTLAVCEERWGHIATAMTRYGDYLSLFDRLPEDRKASQGDRPQAARASREKLAPDVPELTLILPANAPPGTVVKRDGLALSDVAIGVGLPVDPGEHIVTTEAPGGPAIERRITLAKGEKKKETLEVKVAAVQAATKVDPRPTPDTPPKPPPPTGPSGQRVAGFVIGGVGVAGLALGGVLGGLALGKKHILDQSCGAAAGSPDPLACKPAGLDALDAGKGLALGSSIGFGVGLAGVVTGIVLIATDRKPAQPAAGANARAISAGVLAIGPGGAVGGVRGSW